MKSVSLLIILFYLLVSCKSTSSAITPTQLPLSDLDLEEILIKRGDLPMGYVGGQVQDSLPGMFDDIPQPVNQIFQQIDLTNNSGSGGEVAVFVYNSSPDSIKAYDTILSEMGGAAQERDIEKLGEKAHMSGWNLLFLRCNAIVHFRIVGINYDQYISYAQRLDERLMPLVCR
jgi:hypothetical protein